jgi:uncharacterized membrane protein
MNEQQARMNEQQVRVRDKDSLTQFLGWFSLGLGTAQVAAPQAMCRMIGARDDGHAPALMRLMGFRELTQGLGILTETRPTTWTWSRVAGDAVDLALLGMTAADSRHRGRTMVALASVAAVTVADVSASRHLAAKQGQPRSGMLVRKTVTIARPSEEVERAWNDAADLRQKVNEAGALVSFEQAPGGRGTELAVELVYAPPAGDLGAAAQKLMGKDLPTQLADDLRRFKQQIETGEVIRSDSTPEGHLLSNHLKQRPAQPLEEAIR